MKFTFDVFCEILETLSEQDFEFSHFDDDFPNHSVIVRHDVDWSPRKAVKIANMEANHGVTATYCFLASSPFYNLYNDMVRSAIQDIQELGHRIGLHFSTHQYFDSTPDGNEGEVPSENELVEKINQERAVLESIIDTTVEVVSFHNPPKWTYRRSFPGFISTYEKRFFDDIEYLADSNQRWRANSPRWDNLADRTQVLIHPVLWGEVDGSPTDRIREERDFLFKRISEHIQVTDRTWSGCFGIE